MSSPSHRSISEIAREIRRVWKPVYYAAQPYLDAMLELTDRNSTFGHDSAKSIVTYFLSNASTFRGPDARRIKLELKTILSIK